ncbi:MAG: hypothetical protein ACE5FL_01995 [Myxococcota bacterium]
MADLRLIAPPDRAKLLVELRYRLGHAVPGSQLIAEGLLGADAPIDFVAVEPDGRVVLVLVGGHGDDLELVGRGLAQRAWVTARLGDWAQLAPNLGLRRDAPVRVLLLCPDFGRESRTAVFALGRAVLAAGVYRCIQNGAGFEVVVEHLDADVDESPPREEPPGNQRSGDERPESAPFRTGLTDADLGLTPEERREFE